MKSETKKKIIKEIKALRVKIRLDHKRGHEPSLRDVTRLELLMKQIDYVNEAGPTD